MDGAAGAIAPSDVRGLVASVVVLEDSGRPSEVVVSSAVVVEEEGEDVFEVVVVEVMDDVVVDGVEEVTTPGGPARGREDGWHAASHAIRHATASTSADHRERRCSSAPPDR
jgi:hypothetical protein